MSCTCHPCQCCSRPSSKKASEFKHKHQSHLQVFHMGSGASRVASRAVSRVPKASPQPSSGSPDSLASLPANSAVRRDAVDGAALQEQRIAQEAEGLKLEDLNRKDEDLVALMQTTMTTTEGNIHFREHVLPLNDDQFTTELVSKVCMAQLQLLRTCHITACYTSAIPRL